MINELQKAMEYIESLEQRIAALETRLAEQEAYKAKLIDLSVRITELAKESKAINERCTAIMAQGEEILRQNAAKAPEEPEIPETPEMPEEPETPEIPESLEIPEEQESPEIPENLETPEEPEEPEEPETPEPQKPVQASLFGAPVTDIRHAISLGDRFLFQRELFAGKGELMQKTIDKLNGLNSLGEALSYINDNFSWDKDSSTYELFVNVLRRRFN
ncbi:MAG: hypothetical protein IJU36_05945 [Paludibacteraceae bacterium]|nr:hypothetical protein [Paludibacteraceae bacterium]